MQTARKTKYYKKKDQWVVDGVPINTKNRLDRIHFCGIGTSYTYQYKNKNTEKRWKISETLAPTDEAWIILVITFKNNGHYPQLFEKLKMAVKMEEHYITYEWLTSRTLRASKNRHCRKLNILEVAMVEIEINKALTQ